MRLSKLAVILVLLSINSANSMPGKLQQAGAQKKNGVGPLLEDVATFWLKYGPDKHNGGFHATVDRQGKPMKPTDKMIVQQARQLWFFSNLLMARPDSLGLKTADVRAAADTAYDFMRNNMLRDVEGGKLFVFEVSQDGRKVTRGDINLYGNAFAIYGLSSYARATGSTEARNLALNVFTTLDKVYHSPYGGYDESAHPAQISGFALDSVPLNPSASRASKIFTEAGPKAQPKLSQSFNTLLHIAEALTELSRATGGSAPTVTARLSELLELLTGLLVVRPAKPGPNTPAAYIAPNYDPRDWQPVGAAYVDYGHNIEAAWLLADGVDELEARGAVDKSKASRMRSSLQDIGAAATAAGYDNKNGGMYEGSNIDASSPTRPNKVWWTQAEALQGFDWLYRRTGDKSYQDKLQQTLNFVKSHLWDQQYGEWFWQVGPAGGVPLTFNTADIDFAPTVKGTVWKAGYHTGRAMLRLAAAGY